MGRMGLPTMIWLGMIYMVAMGIFMIWRKPRLEIEDWPPIVGGILIGWGTGMLMYVAASSFQPMVEPLYRAYVG